MKTKKKKKKPVKFRGICIGSIGDERVLFTGYTTNRSEAPSVLIGAHATVIGKSSKSRASSSLTIEFNDDHTGPELARFLGAKLEPQ